MMDIYIYRDLKRISMCSIINSHYRIWHFFSIHWHPNGFVVIIFVIIFGWRIFGILFGWIMFFLFVLKCIMWQKSHKDVYHHHHPMKRMFIFYSIWFDSIRYNSNQSSLDDDVNSFYVCVNFSYDDDHLMILSIKEKIYSDHQCHHGTKKGRLRCMCAKKKHQRNTNFRSIKIFWPIP